MLHSRLRCAATSFVHGRVGKSADPVATIASSRRQAPEAHIKAALVDSDAVEGGSVRLFEVLQPGFSSSEKSRPLEES